MIAPKTISSYAGPHYKVEYPKQMLFGHITVSPTSAHYRDGRAGVSGDFAHWNDVRKAEKYSLGTFAIGDADGKIYQGFDDKYWAHHLGIRSADFNQFGLPNINTWINKHSVGYEMDCLGPLLPAPEGNGLYWSAVKSYQESKWIGHIRVPEKNVIYYPDGFRGFHFFEKLTTIQIEKARQYFLHLCSKHGIPTNYNEDQWQLSKRALKATAGIWQHVSVRADKSDAHPQPEYVEMLKGLHPKKTVITVPKPAPIPDTPIVFTNKHKRILKQGNELINLGIKGNKK